MTAINTYLRKLDDMLARPDLQAPAAREQLYHRLLAYWTGQLRREQRTAGTPAPAQPIGPTSGFSPLEMSELLTILDNRLTAHRSDNPTSKDLSP